MTITITKEEVKLVSDIATHPTSTVNDLGGIIKNLSDGDVAGAAISAANRKRGRWC